MAEELQEERDEEGLDEVERYELRAPSAYRFATSRRLFGQTLGAGVMLVVSAGTSRAQTRGRSPRRAERLSERFHLGADGVVTVLTSKVEVGQGARTEITQAAAEELRLPMDRVRLIMADTEQCPDDGGTAGSRTTPSTVPRVRNAAATLREFLITQAAGRLGAPRDQVTVQDGLFRGGGQQVSLAELVDDERMPQSLADASPSEDALVTPIENWQVLGRAQPKVGGREVVTGTAVYPSDIQRPGMLYGKVLRPISQGAQLKSIELDVAQAMEGVNVVRDGEFVGCTAPTSWLAAQAVDSLARTCQWERPPQTSSEELFEHLKQTARGQNRGGGDPQPELSSDEAKQKFDSRYTIAYIQHAPMEPRAAVAEWQDGKLTVWTGSQQPSRVQGELCQVFRLPSTQVRVIVPDTGGGFGGKHTGEVAVEAARLAQAAGRPVSLRWTREEEFTSAYFRPAGLIEVKAGVDADGKLVGWDFTNYNSGGSAIETPYNVPNARSRFVNSDSPLRQGSYRALASTANTFARESAMDELAALAAVDPLEFRLRHLADGRLKDVLQAAAEKFQWRERRASPVKQRGVGLACGTEKGSFVATCAEVEVIDGQIRVIEICQAFECGKVLNPGNLRMQVAGAVIMGLGGALYEAIEFADGQIKNASFSTYRVPRMRDVPKLDLVQLDRPDLPSVGAGETPIIGVAPAIANAVFHACGIRSRSMPLRLS
jgi:CO/xanthine dehydrogenase Mo-binding subunit